MLLSQKRKRTLKRRMENEAEDLTQEDGEAHILGLLCYHESNQELFLVYDTNTTKSNLEIKKSPETQTL